MITTHNMTTGTQNVAPATPAHSSSPSNPVANPVITGNEGPSTKDTRTLEQRLGEIRDIGAKKWPKFAVTARLDLTNSGPGMEFLFICQGIPETQPPTRYGILKAQTVIELKNLVESV